jgi:hypothetical protein
MSIDINEEHLRRAKKYPPRGGLKTFIFRFSKKKPDRAFSL